MATAASSSNSGGGGDPWAWLGLLKWTLSYSDGTKPSDLTPMSDEDKAFLEQVMKDGIIDENERMKFILEEFSKSMEYYHKLSQAAAGGSGGDKNQQPDQPDLSPPPISDDEMEDLLQELRDIVEQIDYARAFVSLKGLQYLLGAINTTTSGIPESIRNMCLAILSTLAQNNPPVQKELLELGAIKTLSDLFLQKDDSNDATPIGDDGSTGISMTTKSRIVQAMSAIVRNYDVTETVFEHLPQAPLLLVEGLNSNPIVTNESLRMKTLFFLRAFLTSDTSTTGRVNIFADAVNMVADPQYLDDGESQQLRESSISLLNQLLERNLGNSILLARKDLLASLGVQRISYLRSLQGEEAEITKTELELWESFLVLLARAKPE